MRTTELPSPLPGDASGVAQIASLRITGEPSDRMLRTRQALLLDNNLVSTGHFTRRLHALGFGVTPAASAQEAVTLSAGQTFDVVIVDLRPDLLGYEAVCRLRIAGIDIPILFVLASSAPQARARALALGADDVMVGSDDADALSDRVVELLHETRRRIQPRLHVGRLTLDVEARQASVGAFAITLMAAEYALLETLVMRNGAPTPMAAILDHIAAVVDDGAKSPTPRTVKVLARCLQAKLTAAGAGLTVAGGRGQSYAIVVGAEAPPAVPFTRRRDTSHSPARHFAGFHAPLTGGAVLAMGPTP